MTGGSDVTDRPRFSPPAPLITPSEDVDRSVLSPFRHSSPVLAAGSPRTTNTLLGASGLQNSSSPKTVPLHKVEGGRFEDPLMSMPSFRRNSAAEPGSPSPLTHSPSFRGGVAGSNSFSARLSTLDLRRSLPGGPSPALGSSPGDSHTGRSSIGRDPRGLSDYGQGNGFPAAAAYASPNGGSESGTRGDDDEPTDADVDLALRLVGCQRSFGISRDAHSPVATPGTSSRTLRSSMRIADEEDFLHRLQHNRASWRERARSGAAGAPVLGAGGAGASEGLQNKTHAALEQLRGELRSLSLRSLHGAAAGSSAVATGGNGGAGAAASSAGHGGAPLSPGQQPASGSAAAGGPANGAGCVPRYSEGYVPVSPSRLFVSHHRSSGGDSAEQRPLVQ